MVCQLGSEALIIGYMLNLLMLLPYVMVGKQDAKQNVKCGGGGGGEKVLVCLGNML